MTVQVEGTVADGYEPVREAFEAAVGAEGQESADCCVYVEGECVVDLRSGRRAGDVQCVFSATKGAVAACANLLVERGLLDLDAPVVRYWPEFGAAGKSATRVRWLLEHKAGVLAPDVTLSAREVGDWDAVCAALAAATPAWEPGTAYGYHAQSYGWLVGEVVRRVDGRGLAEFFSQEIAVPAGADFTLGLPEDGGSRLIEVIPAHFPPDLSGYGPHDVGPPSEMDLSQYVGPHADVAVTFNGALPEDALSLPRDPVLRGLPIAASNGYTDARGLARLYAWLLTALSAHTLRDLTSSRTEGPDVVLSAPAMAIEQHFSRGFEVLSPGLDGSGDAAFGHHGLGCATAFADPARRLAFGFTASTSYLGPPGSDSRVQRLTRALSACVPPTGINRTHT
ncbi:serine hydrolase domain-containing protein [Nonomuraea longicatena]|uniref:Serine hydrolase domain-containing protein n=1 Tax=Nonomuraea longicatena TaxID=83682 RepID=A0ABP3Z8U5_9ACTN